jgi:phytanoyl-CoA hydroxylase
MNMHVTQEHINSFHANGYLVVENLLTDADCDRLCKNAREWCKNAPVPPLVNGVPEQSIDQPFFQSLGHGIGAIWGNHAKNHAELQPHERQPYVGTLGYGLHRVDAIFGEYAAHPKIVPILKALMNAQTIKIVQSMFIYKHANGNAGHGWHQDSTYLYTNPNTTIAAWMALEDVTRDKAPLWYVPGSHNWPTKVRLYRYADDSCKTVTLDSTPNDTSNAVLLSIKKGSVVFFDGQLLHKSDQNRSTGSRPVYVTHYVDANAEWLQENWIRETAETPFVRL